MIRLNIWVRRVRVIELLFALKLYYNLALEILTIEQTELVDQSTNKYMDPIFICVALLFTISQCSLMNYKKRNNFFDASNLASFAPNERNMYMCINLFSKFKSWILLHQLHLFIPKIDQCVLALLLQQQQQIVYYRTGRKKQAWQTFQRPWIWYSSRNSRS